MTGFVPKAYIFDLDGTLCNTMPDLGTAMNEFLTLRGYPTVDEKQLLAAINCGAFNFVRRCLPKEVSGDEAYVTECLEQYRGCYARHVCDRTAPYPGIAEAVRRIREAGKPTAVFSNKDENHVRLIVDRLLPGLFDLSVGAGRFPTKPDPSGALSIAESFGIDPSDFAFVGDSDVDMKTAIAAGMHPWAVTWGYRGEDVLRAAGAERLISSAGQLCQ